MKEAQIKKRRILNNKFKLAKRTVLKCRSKYMINDELMKKD